MKNYYIVLSSVTVAQRLQKVLQNQGIRSTMVHTPKKIADGGCGYSLIVSEAVLSKSLRLAAKNDIKIKKTVVE